MNTKVKNMTLEELEDLKEEIKGRELQIKYDDSLSYRKDLEEEFIKLNELKTLIKEMVKISKDIMEDSKEALENVMRNSDLEWDGYQELISDNRKYYNRFKTKNEIVENLIKEIQKYYE
jgi:hypothetical protein